MMNPLDYSDRFQEVIAETPIWLNNSYSIHFTYPEILNPVINPFIQSNGAFEPETKDGITEAYLYLRTYGDDCRALLQKLMMQHRWPHTVEIIADSDVINDWVRADFRWINGKYMSQVADSSHNYIPYTDILAAFNNNTLDKLKADMELIRDSLQEYSFSSEDIAQAKVQVLKEIVHVNP